MIMAFYIGQSKVVGGTTTDMVAYADKDVFVQVWIGTEDKLPRMVRAVYRTDGRDYAINWKSRIGNSTLICPGQPSRR